jgi:phosphate transport system permease protein
MMASAAPTVHRSNLRRNYRRRVLVNRVATVCLILCAAIALVPLFWVGIYVLQQGWPALFGHFPSVFTEQSTAQGTLLDGFIGTVILIVLSCLVGLPLGLMTGIYLAEYGRNRFGDLVRFVADVLAGLPSIVAGIVAYSVIVLSLGHFTALAGGFALGLLMFPTVARSTEAVVRLVPDTYREAGLALGVARWRTVLSVVVPMAMSGIITGIILGVARVAGETAPLLFTAYGNQNGFVGWNQPSPALPLQIYQDFINTQDPSTDYPLAYAGVLMLFFFVVALNLGARGIAARRALRSRGGMG